MPHNTTNFLLYINTKPAFIPICLFALGPGLMCLVRLKEGPATSFCEPSLNQPNTYAPSTKSFLGIKPWLSAIQICFFMLYCLYETELCVFSNVLEYTRAEAGREDAKLFTLLSSFISTGFSKPLDAKYIF